MHALAYHAQALLDGFLKGAANGHHFAHRLHAAAQFPVHAPELAQVPTGNLAHHIIESGLEEGTGGLGDRILQFKQAVAQSQFGSHESQRVACGLGGQGRGAAQAGIHLYHAVVLALGVERILHVTLAHDADMSDDADGQGTQFVVVGIGQCLAGGNHDAFARVNAQRVKVFHVAHRDTVVIAVAHHLVFYLLPSLEALLHQYLR